MHQTHHLMPRRTQFHVRFIAARGVLVIIPPIIQALLIPKRKFNTPLSLPLPLLPLSPIHLSRPGRSKARETTIPHVTRHVVDAPEALSLDGIAVPHDKTQRRMLLQITMVVSQNQRSGCGGGGSE